MVSPVLQILYKSLNNKEMFKNYASQLVKTWLYNVVEQGCEETGLFPHRGDMSLRTDDCLLKMMEASKTLQPSSKAVENTSAQGHCESIVD